MPRQSSLPGLGGVPPRLLIEGAQEPKARGQLSLGRARVAGLYIVGDRVVVLVDRGMLLLDLRIVEVAGLPAGF